MCLRNAIPRPLPRLAPSIRPGISAITKEAEYSVSTPKFGETVVNGYAAMAGFAAVRMERSVLFPAFGSPTKPTCAKTLRLKRSQRASPGIPGSAVRGVVLVGDLKY